MKGKNNFALFLSIVILLNSFLGPIVGLVNAKGGEKTDDKTFNLEEAQLNEEERQEEKVSEKNPDLGNDESSRDGITDKGLIKELKENIPGDTKVKNVLNTEPNMTPVLDGDQSNEYLEYENIESGGIRITGLRSGISSDDLSDGILSIPDKIEGEKVLEIGKKAFFQKNIESLVLGQYIERIDAYAFAGNSISSLEINDKLKFIGDYAFRDNRLTSLNTRNIDIIGRGAFTNNNLKVIQFINIEGIGDYAFSNNEIIKVSIPTTVRSYGRGVFASNNQYVLIETDNPLIKTEVIKGEYGQVVNPVLVTVEFIDKETGKKIISDEVIGDDYSKLDGIIILNEENTFIPKNLSGYEPLEEKVLFIPDSQDYKLVVEYRNISKKPIIEITKTPFIEANGDGSMEVLKSFVMAKDFEGNDITEQVTVEPNFLVTDNPSKEKVTYSVTDKYGNTSSRTITVSIGTEWSNFPLGKGWVLGDFIYDGNKVTGFSESGLEKVETQKELILPHLNPNDGSTEVDTVAIQENNRISFRSKGLTSVSDFENNIITIEGSWGPYSADRKPGAFESNRIENIKFNSVEYVGPKAFDSNRLTKIQLPKATYMGDSSIADNQISVIDENDLPLVEEVGSSFMAKFGNGGPLEKVHMPSLKTIRAAAFLGNQISDVSMPKLELIEANAFAENKITELTPSDFTSLKVLESGAFRNNQISIIDLPTVVELEEAFRGNPIKEVKDNFKSLEVLGSRALDNMNIKELTIPKLKSLAPNTFINNPGSEEWENKVVIWTDNNSIPSKANYIINPKKANDLDTWTEEDFTWDTEDPSKVTGLTNTGNLKLAHKDYALELPDRAKIVGREAFERLGVKSVVGREIHTVEDSGFYGNKLTDINSSFPKLQFIRDSWAFGSNQLTSLSHLKIEIIGENAFTGNKISEISLDNVKEMGEKAFWGNPVSQLKAPELIKIGKAVFADHLLTELNLPKVEEIGLAAFSKIMSSSAYGYRYDYPDRNITGYGKRTLDKVTLPNVKTIKDLAFAGNQISEVEMPRVETIERRAFDENKLMEISFPNVTKIGPRAFGSNRIDEAYFGEGLKLLDETSFRNNRNSNKSKNEVKVFTTDRKNPNNLKDGYIGKVRQHIINPTKVIVKYVDIDGNELAESFTEYILKEQTYYAINKFGYQVDKQSQTVSDNREENIVTFTYEKKDYPDSIEGFEIRQDNERDLNTGVRKERYYIGEKMSTNIYLDLTGIEPSFTRGTIKIYYDPKFIDESSISIPRGSANIEYDRIKASNGVYEIPVKNIGGGYNLEFPINWKFNKYVTPDNYRLEMNALFEAGSKVVTTAEPVYLEGYYNKANLTKMSPLNVPDYDYGFRTSADNGPRLMGELTKYVTPENTYEFKINEAYPVKYEFGVPNLERYVDKAVLTETLPEYIAVKEDGSTEIRRAVFDQNLNPNWTLQEDGITLIQNKEFPKTISPTSNMDPLYLSFPDLKSGYSVENIASIELTPNDKGIKEENIIATDELSIYTAFYHHVVYEGDPRFEKFTAGRPWSDDFRTYFYDVKEDKEKVIPFLLRVSSMAEKTDLRDVTITDYGLDSRLYYHGVSFPRNDHTAGNQVVTILAFQKTGDKMNPNEDKILFQQTLAMKNGNDIVFDESYAKEIDYVHIILNKEHKVHSALEFHINTKVREPEKKLYTYEGLSNANVFQNYAVMAGNLYQKGTLEESWKRTEPIKDNKGVNVSSYQEAWDNIPGNYLWGSKDEVVIKEMNPDMGIEKSQTFPDTNSRLVNPGELGSYNLRLLPMIGGKKVSYIEASKLIKEDLKDFKMIDLMPNVVLAIEVKMTPEFQNSGGSYEIVSNYNDTGRTAIIFTADRLKAGVYNIANIWASVEPTTEEGFVTNELYASFDNPNIRKIGVKEAPPKESGEWLKDQTSFKLQKVKELYARKYIKKASENLWSSTGIITESEEALDYRLSLANNVDKARSNIEIVDIFPYGGDLSIQEENIGSGKRFERASEFANTYDLSRQVEILDGKGLDVRSSYMVYYWNSDSNIDYRGQSADKTIKDLTWSSYPAENTKAIKIVSKEGVEIEANDGINVIIPMKAPKNDLGNNFELTGKRAWNSFVRKDEQTIRFLEPNKVYNEMAAPMGSIEFIKYGQEELNAPAEAVRPLQGAKFNLLDKEGVVISEVTSDVRGRVKFENLPVLEEYTIKEVEAPEEYIISDGEIKINYEDFKRQFEENKNFDIKLSEEESQKNFLNIKPVYGDLKLEKVNEKGDRLAYIKFNLKGLSKWNEDFNENYLTGPDGTINVSRLIEGEYRLTELSNPEETGYTVVEPIEFTIDKDNREIRFTGDKAIVNKKLQVIINKIAVESGFDISQPLLNFTNFGMKKLSGYKFIIREADNPGNKITTEATENGVVKLSNLKIDTLYEIEEVEKDGTIYKFNPNKYEFKLNEKAEITDKDGNVFRQNIINFPNPEKPVEGKIIVEKLDDNMNALEGAVFGVFKDGEIIQGETTKIIGGKAIAVFENLESGSYVLKEISAPLGYVKSEAEYEFLIPYRAQENMLRMEDYEVKDDAIVKRFDYTYHNSKFEVNVIKRDTHLENVTIEFAENFILENPDYDMEVVGPRHATLYKALEGVEFELNEVKSDGGREFIGSYTSNRQGRVDFEGYKFNEAKNYELVEVKALDGYRLDKKPLKLYLKDEVKKDDFKGTISQYMDNKPIKGRIIISKYSLEEKEVLSGAKFAIYKIDSNGKYDPKKPFKTGTTNKNGILEFRDLELGNYLVKEVKAPDNYQIINGELRVELTSKDSSIGLVFNNSSLLSFEVDKKWIGKKLPYVDILVLANGLPALDKDGKEVGPLRLSETNNWKIKIQGLPRYKMKDNLLEVIEYSISEINTKGYKSEVVGNVEDGFVITNTEIPDDEKTSIRVKKVWEDNDNEDGLRPETIELSLIANGNVDEPVSKKIIRSESNGDWYAEFNDIPVYKDGEKINYTIVEKTVDGYTSVVDDSYSDYIVVTNKRIPDKPEEGTTIKVSKRWEGLEKDSIIVNLYANGSKIETKLITKDMDWEYSFENLDKYKDGKEIEYTIEEVGVEGYRPRYEVLGDGEFLIINRETPPDPKEPPNEIPPEPKEPPKDTPPDPKDPPKETPPKPDEPLEESNIDIDHRKPKSAKLINDDIINIEKVKTKINRLISPKTYDPGIGIYITGLALAISGLIFFKKKK